MYVGSLWWWALGDSAANAHRSSNGCAARSANQAAFLGFGMREVFRPSLRNIPHSASGNIGQTSTPLWHGCCVPQLSMTSENLTIHSTKFEGHVATFRCRLARDHGWDVSAELDSTVLRECHCNDWCSVERVEVWLLGKLCESSVLTSPF